MFRLAFGTALIATVASAQPSIVEPGWDLVRTIEFNNPVSARFHPDGLLYMLRRGTGSDGLYRVLVDGTQERLVASTNPAAILVHDSGDIFMSEDYSGEIDRITHGTWAMQVWAHGFHAGDDDPVGMAVAPPDYTGSVLQPGQAVVADRGNGGLDEVWGWSPEVREEQFVIHADDGTLIECDDVAIDETTVYVVDMRDGNPGWVCTVTPGGAMVQLVTDQPMAGPSGIDIDAYNGDLIISDRTDQRIVRVDPTTAVLGVVLTGLGGDPGWCGVDVSNDGDLMAVTVMGADRVYIYSRCVAHTQEEDCNDNDVRDDCEVRAGLDCNGNGVVDECDIAGGTSEDCNANGLPDECETFTDCNGNGVPDPCDPAYCAADLAPPFGVLNVFDFLGFQTRFSESDACADLAPPAGAFNVFDFLEFQSVFGNGC